MSVCVALNVDISNYNFMLLDNNSKSHKKLFCKFIKNRLNDRTSYYVNVLLTMNLLTLFIFLGIAQVSLATFQEQCPTLPFKDSEFSYCIFSIDVDASSNKIEVLSSFLRNQTEIKVLDLDVHEQRSITVDFLNYCKQLGLNPQKCSKVYSTSLSKNEIIGILSSNEICSGFYVYFMTGNKYSMSKIEAESAN